MEHFILVADVCCTLSLTQRCRMLNNFSSMWAILSALNSTSIFRLRRTWDLLGFRTMKTFERANAITLPQHNFAAYRELLCKVTPPCVPFFGLYTKDLTFIEDGNPDTLICDSHLINFTKRKLLAEVILEVKTFQNTPYNFMLVPAIERYLDAHLVCQSDDQERYQRSLEIEPRERYDSDELTTRDASGEESFSKMLQENGFL